MSSSGSCRLGLSTYLYLYSIDSISASTNNNLYDQQPPAPTLAACGRRNANASRHLIALSLVRHMPGTNYGITDRETEKLAINI